MNNGEFLDLIKSHIEEYGYHITIVNSHTDPRFAYMIGLSALHGFELIFAGGINYLRDELALLIDLVIEELTTGTAPDNFNIANDSLGSFSLKSVDNSWTEMIMPGVFDYYKKRNMHGRFKSCPTSRTVPSMYRTCRRNGALLSNLYCSG